MTSGNDWFLKREYLRMACAFCAESATSIFLVVFVQHFVASGAVKGCIAAGTFVGFLLSPLLLPLLRSCALSSVHSMASLYGIAALGYLCAASFEGEYFVAFGLILGTAGAAATTPYSTALWRANVPEAMRGRLFGQSLFVGYSARIVFSWVAGEILQGAPERYSTVAIMLAVLMLLAALIVRSYEGLSIDEGAGTRLRLRDISAVFLDRKFSFLLAVWMLFGAANLAVLPLRADFLGSGKEIPALDPREILFIMEIVPSLIRILFVQLWGRLFDRFGFYRQRVMLNLLMAAGILCFFSVDSRLRFLGVVLWSLGHSGGSLMWNLWVTAFAPAGRTTAYMSVHTACTGLRGCISPSIAYLALEYLPARTIAVSSAFLVVLATSALFSGAKREGMEAKRES